MHVVRLQTTFVVFGCTQHNLNKFRSAFICSKIQVQVFTEHEGTKSQRVLNVNSNDNETLIAHEFTQINTNLRR